MYIVQIHWIWDQLVRSNYLSATIVSMCLLREFKIGIFTH